MKRRVVVTGLGAVTSLSCRVADLWNRILNGESGIHAIRLFDTSGHKVKFGGDVWDWTTGEPPKTNPAYYLRFCKSYSRMGGRMNYLQCDNASFIHHLYRALVRHA